jgi:serine/threonine protein kinase/formylglycine-generating enzyme required for sulfatase activity
MEILNKYRYDPQTDLLGRGGFATVYKAYDKILDMPVALKFFQSQDAANKYTIINEIKRAIILSHPNIVKYYGVETLINRNFHGQEEEVQIGVMELVQEGQMKTYMTHNPLNLDQLKKLLIDILEGLKYLHSEGVIHRDIKPQNILLGRDKQNRLVAKIADFGISKSADSNQASASILLGTIEYMAPEQFNPERYGINKKIGYNVDIWAFGVTAYYLLTGNLLFGSRSGDTSAAQMISKIVNAEGLGNKLSLLEEPFRSALQKCIVSNANDRTNDIDELIAILKGQVYKKDQTNIDAYAPNSQMLHHFSNAQHASNDETENLSVSADDHTQEISIPTAAPSGKQKKEKSKAIIADNDSTQEIQRPVNSQNDIEEATGKIVQKKKSKTGLIIAMIVFIIASAAGGAYYKFSGLSTEELLKNKYAAENLEQEKKELEVEIYHIISNMLEVTGGTFNMGTNDAKRNTDGPEHKVTVGNFLLYENEVTQREWNAIMGDNRYKDTLKAKYPADEISWNDATAFITTLNKKVDTLKSKGKLDKVVKFRLPKDAEWEYACLESLQNVKDINDVSWNINNSKKESHEVGSKSKTTNGFYDLLGNVYEWTDDWYGPYNQVSPKEGKVIRGGDYENDIFFVHPKARNAEVVNKRNKNIGFRLAGDLVK